MTQTNLLDLKFKKEYSEDKDWYYYVYDLTDGVTLISPASDETQRACTNGANVAPPQQR